MADAVTQSEQLLQAIQARAGKKKENWCELHQRKLTRIRTPQGKRYYCRKCDTETAAIWKAIDAKKQELADARAAKEKEKITKELSSDPEVTKETDMFTE